MEAKNMILEPRDGWLEVTFNRPEALNAFNSETMTALEEVVEHLETSDALRGMILTGAGEKAFVAGADINELTSCTPPQAMARAGRGQSVFNRVENATKPVIAAVNGFALGGGCELAMACHLRVFSQTARVGLPEVSLGVIPGYGGTQRLARIVGIGRALEILLTGNMIDADEAYRIGLANRVVEPVALMDTCREIAGSINKRGPRAVSAALQAAIRGRDMSLQEGLAFEAAQFGLVAGTEDWREGTSAFLEKRKPKFSGR